jgi:endonuclease/exonuclease/phosphatase (EEP) superfamily protein YafD
MLTVMSFNMFGFNEHPDAVITALRAANADVIAIQELNPPAADAIRRDLTREFPYQILDPHEETIGSGVISRYPLRASDETLPGEWGGIPQVLMLDWQGTAVTLLHIHAIPTNFSPREFLWSADIVEWTLRERERQAHAIVDFARAHPGPLIVVGDFNAGDQSTAYAIVTNALIDSWREAGWGLGHTFLGGNPWEGTHPTMAGIAMSLWLLRIDYVFHSRHWQAVSAEVGPWDGFSDHRSVVVRLR